MKSIYDMMGKYTYPALREEAPREHVESFFQVPGSGEALGWPWGRGEDTRAQEGTYLSIYLSFPLPLSFPCLTTFLQKMDRNKDGVVTIEEFIESCQQVWLHTL